MAEVKRAVRVGERIREEIAGLITRDIQDPRVNGASVTNVAMTDDLQLAKVRVRREGLAEADLVGQRSLLKGLESASGVIRRELGRRLGLRYAPKLVFYYDEAPEKRGRIDALLNEIAVEPKVRDPEGDA